MGLRESNSPTAALEGGTEGRLVEILGNTWELGERERSREREADKIRKSGASNKRLAVKRV